MRPQISTVAALPATCEPGQPVMVTDGTTTFDCSTGSGSVRHWCVCNATGNGYNATAGPHVHTRTKSFSFNLEAPVTGDNGQLQHFADLAFTITLVRCSTDTGTVTININERAEATPNTTGDDALSAGLVCDTNSQDSCAAGCDVSTIQNQPIDENDPIALEIDATSGSPGWLRVHVEGTVSE